MLMARVAFDLLRSEAFQSLVTAHVQRKMNELRLPDFMNSIEVRCHARDDHHHQAATNPEQLDLMTSLLDHCSN